MQRGERLLADRGRGRFGQTRNARSPRSRCHGPGREPFSPGEQAAAREVNRHSTGRKARTSGTVEQAVDGGAGRVEGAPELPAGLLQRTRDAVSAETGIRLDIHAAHADWQRWVAGMKEPIRSPAGHFVDFCKRRAKELR